MKPAPSGNFLWGGMDVYAGTLSRVVLKTPKRCSLLGFTNTLTGTTEYDTSCSHVVRLARRK
jgi:hypothetical protein